MGIEPISAAVTAGLGVIQAVGGKIQHDKAVKEINALVASRKPFKTPDEVYKSLNATENRVGQGLGASTLAYLTGETDSAFSGAIGSNNLLGGDANSASALFSQKMSGIMKIGAENHLANLSNFTRYLGALDTLGKNKEAEQVSADNLIKDGLQAASAKGGQGTLALQGGINTALAGLSAYQQSQLYQDRTKAIRDGKFTELPGATNITRETSSGTGNSE